MSEAQQFELRLKEALRDRSVRSRVELKSELLDRMKSDSREPWIYDLLSRIDESLKKYVEAHRWIRLKCERSGQTLKRDRKRLGVLAQHLRDQQIMPMPKEHQEDMLTDFSSMEWETSSVHESRSRTQEWLNNNVHSLAIQEAVLDHFKDLKLDSDFEIFQRLRRTVSPEINESHG